MSCLLVCRGQSFEESSQIEAEKEEMDVADSLDADVCSCCIWFFSANFVGQLVDYSTGHTSQVHHVR